MTGWAIPLETRSVAGDSSTFMTVSELMRLFAGNPGFERLAEACCSGMRGCTCESPIDYYIDL